MNILYRKVLCSERLPDEGGAFGTNKGELFFLIAAHHWFYDAEFTVEPPEWWLEEVNIPTGEEIKKMAELFADKKWDKYCDRNNISSSEREQDIYDKIIGISHTEYDYERGFKVALELLTCGK